MPSSVDNYEIFVGDQDTPSSQTFTVAHGTASLALWSVDCATGEITVAGPIESSGALKLNNRNASTSGYIVKFLDSSGSEVAQVNASGGWHSSSSEGVAIETVTGGLPSSAATGRTVAYHQPGSPDKYWLAVWVGTAWKKVPLPN